MESSPHSETPANNDQTIIENNFDKNISSNQAHHPSPHKNLQQHQIPSDSTEPIHSDSDDESYTAGRPSPEPLTQKPKPQHPLSTESSSLPNVTGSPIKSSPSPESSPTSPIRSKKRAIGTMLEGEDSKECISVERQPAPPLPKRQTPPTGIKAKMATTMASPPLSSYVTFIDLPMYLRDEESHQEMRKMLDSYRQGDGKDSGMSIFDFLDKWIKETWPNAIKHADGLFEILIEDYHPATDERLVARICLVMSQILQRKSFPLRFITNL